MSTANVNEVWFAIPSANPELCRKHLPAWREQGYRIAVLQNRERADIPADRCVWSDHYPGWAASINRLCAEVVPTDACIVVSGGDDMLPDPDHSAQEIAAQFLDRFPDTFGVMQPHGDDYWNATLYCGSPWIGRAFFERMYGGTGPVCGDYHHNWGDAELFCVAEARGALWLRPDLSQRHEHFTRDGVPPPAYWEQEVQAHAIDDNRRFLARAGAGFPGHAPTGDGTPYAATDSVRRTVEFAAESFGRMVEWSTRREILVNGKAARLRNALAACAERGVQRVAIYGGGQHTLEAGAALRDPPAAVVGIIDDNRHGTCWGFPVLSPDDAIARGATAVILSSDQYEDLMWERTAGLRERGVEVVRLYGETPSTAELATVTTD